MHVQVLPIQSKKVSNRMLYRINWMINEDIDDEKLNWVVENVDEMFSDVDETENGM